MFELANPWLLLLLPIPWLVRKLLKPETTHLSTALRIPFYQNLAQITQQIGQQTPRLNQRKYLAWLAWVLLVIAACGPQWLGNALDLPQSGRDIMLALDISGSMQLKDMAINGNAVNRLAVVKQAASQFIHSRVGDRIGLILFGTRAYLQTPLTFDRTTVQNMLDDATIGLAGQRTAIGDAIGLAIKRLMKTPEKSRVLILLTDGVSNAGVLDPLRAATLAAQQHIKIYTIGLGANRMIVQGLFGPQVVNPSSDLDEATLQQIAKDTGGLFFRATNNESLQQVYQRIDQLEPISADKNTFRPITAYYYWPLLLALLITLYYALRLIVPNKRLIGG